SFASAWCLLLLPRLDRFALQRVGADFHDLERYAVGIRDPADPRFRYADGRVVDLEPGFPEVRDAGRDVTGLDADVRDAGRRAGSRGQELDERVARELQVRQAHAAVRV